MKYTKTLEIGGNLTALLEDGGTRRVAEYRGTSSRVKPTKADGARDGDQLYDMDTKKGYLFDEETDTWYPV